MPVPLFEQQQGLSEKMLRFCSSSSEEAEAKTKTKAEGKGKAEGKADGKFDRTTNDEEPEPEHPTILDLPPPEAPHRDQDYNNNNNQDEEEEEEDETTLITVCVEMKRATRVVNHNTHNNYLMRQRLHVSASTSLDRFMRLCIQTMTKALTTKEDHQQDPDEIEFNFDNWEIQHGVPVLRTLLTPLRAMTLQQAGIRHLDRVLVVARNANANANTNANATSSVSATSTTSTSTTTTSTTGRTKRKAALMAEASWESNIIHNNDHNGSDNSQQTTSNKNTKESTKRRIITTFKKTPLNHNHPSKSKSSKSTLQFGGSPGRRLRDGAASQQQQQPIPKEDSMKNDDLTDIMEDRATLAALSLLDPLSNSSSSSSSKNKNGMRQYWKAAVMSAYEQNQAVARLAAIASHQYGSVRMVLERKNHPNQNNTTITTTGTSNDVDDDDDSTGECVHPHPQLLVVTYPRGIQGPRSGGSSSSSSSSSFYVDTVDCVPQSVLQSVLAQVLVHDREALRGQNLALLSPRVFWSLLYHHQQQQNQQQHNQRPTKEEPEPEQGSIRSSSSIPVILSAMSVDEALRSLLPDLDWNFLRRRKEQLSEKAQENVRQQQQKQQKKQKQKQKKGTSATSSSSMAWEAAAAALESVEHAMANPHHAVRLHPANTGNTTVNATAHPEDTDTGSPPTAWVLETPSAIDVDELRACIRVNEDSSPQQQQQQQQVARETRKRRNRTEAVIIETLLGMGIHNWRQLANADPASIMAHMNEAALDDSVPHDAVHAWITKAQEESLSEIMWDVCSGHDATMDQLHRVHSATPKDLAVWKNIVPLLREQITTINNQPEESTCTSTRMNNQQKQKKKKKGEVDVDVVSESELQECCDRAQQALDQVPWLNLFSTPL